MIRRHDWLERLQELVQSRMTVPFEYGVNECCTFCADAVLAMTGHDPMSHLRGKWSSEREALKVLKNLGGLLNAVLDVLGPSHDPNYSQRGDVVYVTGDRDSLLTVNMGEYLMAPSKSGMAYLALSTAHSSWAIGR